ncbi:MAG: FG-GAP repeat protein, partial [Chloroflexota bacterium]
MSLYKSKYCIGLLLVSFLGVYTSYGQELVVLGRNGSIGGLTLFGSSVAIDSGSIAIGAKGIPLETRGRIHFYEKNNTIWRQISVLTAKDGTIGDFLGGSVSVSGQRAVVGASNASSAYIIEKVGGTWVEKQKIPSPNLSGDDAFGFSVKMKGETLIIGAPADDEMGEHAGAVYVYELLDSTWTIQQKIT